MVVASVDCILSLHCGYRRCAGITRKNPSVPRSLFVPAVKRGVAPQAVPAAAHGSSRIAISAFTDLNLSYILLHSTEQVPRLLWYGAHRGALID